MPSEDKLRLSADIVAAYVIRNAVPFQAVGDLINTVSHALSGLDAAPAIAAPAERERRKPATPISRSIQPDHIVCLEDGRKLKMLKRYLRARYNLSPEEYRRRWGLGPDYPMIAPQYAERRSAFAKELGLGKGVRRGSK